MNINEVDPPRSFDVGVSGVTLKHCADVRLCPDEMVTFVSPDGHEYDVVRKAWGYYATPSIDERLRVNGFRVALVHNSVSGRLYIVLVEEAQIAEWEQYSRLENLKVVSWLSDFAIHKDSRDSPKLLPGSNSSD